MRYETATSIPLVTLSIVFIAAYSVQVLDTHLPAEARLALTIVIIVIWVVFAVDYLIRLLLSPNRKAYFKATLRELLSVVIPVFRPFLLLSHLKQIPFFRSRSGASVRTTVVIHAALFVILFVYSISLAVLAVERDAPGATITNFGDAIWWACVTVATVGYGDVYPVTAFGRLLAVILMAGGIAIVGIATATIVSYLGERISHRRHEDPSAVRHDEAETERRDQAVAEPAAPSPERHQN